MTILSSRPLEGTVLPDGWTFGILHVDNTSRFGRWFQYADGSIEEFSSQRTYASWEVDSYIELALLPKKDLDALRQARDTFTAAPMVAAITESIFDEMNLADRHLR